MDVLKGRSALRGRCWKCKRREQCPYRCRGNNTIGVRCKQYKWRGFEKAMEESNR